MQQKQKNGCGANLLIPQDGRAICLRCAALPPRRSLVLDYLWLKVASDVMDSRMELTRRQLSMMLALAQAQLSRSENSILPSRCYKFEDLPVKTNSKTGAKTRQVFRGATHDGVPVDLHITTMPPGEMPHPPHHHTHEEIFLIQQGALEATIAGKTTIVGPGSVIYIHSNEEHGVKATGDIPAQYFVFAIGDVTA